MEKKARAGYPINDVIAKRWSPRAFDPRKVPGKEFILSLLEATRWAPSAFNEQPWRFLLAARTSPEEFSDMLACLVPANRVWCQNAALLLVGLAETCFEKNGKTNPTAIFDLGLAVENLLLETTSKGMFGHVMSGFDAEKVRHLYNVPSTVEPVVMIALGYRGDPDALPEDLREQEMAMRERKQVYEFTFHGTWGNNRGI